MYVTQEDKSNEGIKPTMYGLIPGDKIEVTQWNRCKAKSFVCIVVQEHKNFITVDRGRYRDTIDKLLIQQKQMKIERIDNMSRKLQPPPKEQLIEMCKKYPTKTKAMHGIAKELGISHMPVNNWIKEYGINEFGQSLAPNNPIQTIIEDPTPELLVKVEEKCHEIKMEPIKEIKSKLLSKQYVFENFLFEIDRENQCLYLTDDTSNEVIGVLACDSIEDFSAALLLLKEEF